MKHTFNHRKNLILILVAGQIPAYFDSPFELALQQITFIEKQYDLRPGKQLRRTYRFPKDDRILQSVDTVILFETLIKYGDWTYWAV